MRSKELSYHQCSERRARQSLGKARPHVTIVLRVRDLGWRVGQGPNGLSQMMDNVSKVTRLRCSGVIRICIDRFDYDPAMIAIPMATRLSRRLSSFPASR
jgi:hypothetical protein